MINQETKFRLLYQDKLDMHCKVYTGKSDIDSTFQGGELIPGISSLHSFVVQELI